MSLFKKIFLAGIVSVHMLAAQAQTSTVFPVVQTQSLKGFSQDIWKDGIRYNFDEKGSRYIKLVILGQFWARYNQNNPGTLFFDEEKASQWDFSLRRMRMQLLLQPHERWFVYTHWGINNFNYVSARKPSFFLHDFSVEYMPVKKHLYIGAGLHSWGTSSRFGASGTANIMGLDLPVYQEPLNDQTDQFVRNLGIYMKGSISKLNYRLALNKPFAFGKSDSYNAANPISAYPNFSPRDPLFELGTYLEWNFFEQEVDRLPYKAGTYLGTKRVFNVGAGARYRPKAMWYRTSSGDTVFSPIILGTVDLFVEMPFKKGGKTAFNVYGAYTFSDFGPGYLRHVGPNGIATGSNLPASHIYGTGNSAPIVGTGNSLYFQGGILTPSIRKTELRFMPYGTFFIADYRIIKNPIILYEGGVNLFVKGNALKLTAGWQNRPFFYTADSKALRRNMAIVQLQFAI